MFQKAWRRSPFVMMDGFGMKHRSERDETQLFHRAFRRLRARTRVMYCSSMEAPTCRLIDRPMRPLFNPDIRNELQFIINVLSFDGQNDPDVLAMIASYA